MVSDYCLWMMERFRSEDEEVSKLILRLRLKSMLLLRLLALGLLLPVLEGEKK